MKKVYDYLCQFIDNEVLIYKLSSNTELMCTEYKNTKLRIDNLKDSQDEIEKNIIDRLNFIFNIKPKWYRKGFKIVEYSAYYKLIPPRLDRTSKEYYCLKYLWKKLEEKYNSYKYDDLVYHRFYSTNCDSFQINVKGR